MSFRLQTFLDLRLRRERAAERELARFAARRLAAEAEQRRLDERAAAAQRSLAVAPYDVEAGPAARAKDADRVRARRRDRARAAASEAHDHRTGVMAEAIAREAAARVRLSEARQARKAIETIRDRDDEARRLLAERRADDAASDLASARARVMKEMR